MKNVRILGSDSF